MTPREDTDPLFPPPPQSAKEGESTGASKEPVRLKPGYVPDNLKVKTAQTNGELAAQFQAKSFTPHAGQDTQPPTPAVVIDQTHKEGIPGDVIRRLAAKLDAERRQGETTQSIDAVSAPKKNKIALGLLIAIAALVVVVALFIKSKNNAVNVDASSTSVSSSPNVVPTNTASAVATTAETSTAASAQTTSASSAPMPPTTMTASATGKSAPHPTAPRASTSAPAASHHPSDWPGQQL